MYATNINSQAIDSRNRIMEALLTLMQQYPYKEITITQICQEAQIVRQTYYRNFELKDDILRFYLDEMVRKYFEDYYQENDAHAQLRNFFSYMLTQKDFLQIALKNNLFFMIDQAISMNITRFLNFQQLTTLHDSELENYVTGFIAATICSLLSLWVGTGFAKSPEMMAGMARQFLGGLHSNDEFL